MSYVARVLQPGETVVQVAHLHWIMYARPFFFIAVAAAVAIGARQTAINDQAAVVIFIGAVAVGAFGILNWLIVWFRKWTTEIAVTDRRVIFKTGFIRRETNEMNIHRVETVNVEQSVLGRLLNFGTLTIRGTGAGIENVDAVADPLKVRGAITAPQAGS